jgi:hypothetical protein
MTAHVTGAFFALPLFLPPFRLGNAAMHALCVFRISSGKYGANGISPTKTSKFTCFTRKKLVKFRDVITPFSGISATSGDFTSEKRCVLTQKN